MTPPSDVHQAPARPAAPTLSARSTLILGLMLLGSYAYFFQAGGWNANSRFALVRSLVERGRADITPYRLATGDLALRDGRYYCDKAPGASWLALPAYALAHHLAGGGKRPTYRVLEWGLYLVILWSVALPSTVLALVLAHSALRLGLTPHQAVALALAYGWGTLAFPYSTLFYGHQLTAALLFGAFAWLAARRADPRPTVLVGVGLLLGAGAAVEYAAALAVAVLLVYATLLLRPRIRLAWLIAGMVVPGLALAAYDARAFGSPFTIAYSFSTLPQRHLGFFMGIDAIDTRVLVSQLFGAYRGLFFSAPWLLAALPGAVLLFKRGQARLEACACAAIVILFLLLNAALVDWHGGYAAGPRYLVPALPFLALLAGGVTLARWSRPLARTGGVVLALAVAASILLMLAATAVRPEVPLDVARPFQDYLIPAFVDGRLGLNPIPVHRALPPAGEVPLAWNLGQCLGLAGLTSLAPLLAFEVLGGLCLLLSLRPARVGETPR
jgi:hypothetical protein